MNRLTTLQLSEYLGVTKRTIQRRAINEGWIYEPEFGLGGVRNLYPFATLPLAVRQKVATSIMRKHEQLGANYDHTHGQITDLACMDGIDNRSYILLDAPAMGGWLSQHCFAHKLETDKPCKQYVKSGLLVMAKLYIYYFSLGKIKGYDQFCQQYNQRTLAINKVIYNTLPRISRVTLIRWEKRQLQQEQERLQHSKEPEVLLDAELQLMAQEVLMVSPNISAARLKQHFEAVFKDRRLPSLRQLSLWMENNSL